MKTTSRKLVPLWLPMALFAVPAMALELLDERESRATRAAARQDDAVCDWICCYPNALDLLLCDHFVCTEANGDPNYCVKILVYLDQEHQFVNPEAPCTEQAGKTCTPGGLTRPCALYGEGEKIDGGCPAAACPYVMDICYCDDCSTGDM